MCKEIIIAVKLISIVIHYVKTGMYTHTLSFWGKENATNVAINFNAGQVTILAIGTPQLVLPKFFDIFAQTINPTAVFCFAVSLDHKSSLACMDLKLHFTKVSYTGNVFQLYASLGRGGLA